MLLLCSCSSIRLHEQRAMRSGDRQLNEHIESYYETIWNPENNRKGERDSIIELIKKTK